MRPVATEEECAAAAAAWAEDGLDGLVARVPAVYRRNKELYAEGHDAVRLSGLTLTHPSDPLHSLTPPYERGHDPARLRWADPRTLSTPLRP